MTNRRPLHTPALIALLLAGPATANPAPDPAPNTMATITATYHSHEEYYCVTEGTITYSGAEPLREINGFFEIFKNGEQIGHSRGTSWLDLQPGDERSALFRAPNVPCDTADTYVFVVSACMQGTRFINKTDCAARITATEPVIAIRPR